MKLTTIEDLQNADAETVRDALTHVQFIPKIEAHLEDLNLEPHSKRLGVFSASDLGNKDGQSLCKRYPIGCARKLYYRYVGVTPQDRVPPRLRRIFDTGSHVHLQLQGYLHKAAEESEVEIFADEIEFNENNSEMADRYDIESTTDGVWRIDSPDLGLKYGLEIKSMKSELFAQLSRADASHVVQSHVYMACLDLPFMVVLYYSKNDSNMAEFVVQYDQKVWDAITKKIDYVREHALEETEPKREAGFHCRTCRYAFICKPPKTSSTKMRRAKRKFGKGGR